MSIEWNSSPVNWCEKDYVYSNNIAEFWNTVSSLYMSAVSIWWWNNNLISKRILTCLFFVGIFSAYFHSTLSRCGQLADELGILVLMFFVLQQIYPVKVYFFAPPVITSIIVLPTYSAYIMLSSGCILAIDILKKSRNLSVSLNVKYYTITGGTLTTVSIILWTIDKMFCKYIYPLHLHFFWHIIISHAICQLNVGIKALSKTYSNADKKSVLP